MPSLGPCSAHGVKLASGPLGIGSRLDHTIFGENRELTARQSQFVAKDFRVVLADQRRPPGDPPRRAVINGGFAWVDKAAAELRVLDLFPETTVLQVGVIKERLRGSHRSPGEAALLSSMVDLFRRQAGYEIGDEIAIERPKKSRWRCWPIWW